MKVLIIKKGHEKRFEKALKSGNKKRVQGYIKRGTIAIQEIKYQDDNSKCLTINMNGIQSGTVTINFDNTNMNKQLKERMIKNAMAYNRNLTRDYLEKLTTHQLLNFCGSDERNMFASEIIKQQ